MFAIVFSDGQIKFSEINKECREEKWIPIAVLRYQDESISVPCFEINDTAKQFAKRNFPKNWVQAAILLGDNELEFIERKGWKVEILHFPQLFTSRKDVRLDFEVLDFFEKPNVRYT
jgi:hypothetical protein